MSQSLMLLFREKLIEKLSAKNSWGKNELILEIQRTENEVLHEALSKMPTSPTTKDLNQIK